MGSEALQDVQAHGVARCLVQDQGEAIELHHLMEPAGQLVEQRGQIAVRDDRFRNGQQGSVPLAASLSLRITLKPCHGECPERPQLRNDQEGVALLLFAVA